MQPGGQRARLEAGAHPRLEGGEPARWCGAGHEAAGDRGGDDVGRRAAAGDHAVHLVARRQLLAQEAEGDLGDRHRIERVDAFPGCGRGVGLLAGEDDVEVGHGQAGRRSRRSTGQGWTIMAAWTPSKAPRSSMRILPPPPSSAGVPRTRTFRPIWSATAARAKPGPHRARGDDVVAAGVPDVGQRVVLGADRDDQLAVARPGLECGGDVVDALGRPSRPPARSASATAWADLVSS